MKRRFRFARRPRSCGTTSRRSIWTRLARITSSDASLPSKSWLASIASRRKNCSQRTAQLKQELVEVERAESDLSQLRKEQATALESYRTLAAQLTARRATAGRALAKDITARMQTLGMAGGRFAGRDHSADDHRARASRRRPDRVPRDRQSRVSRFGRWRRWLRAASFRACRWPCRFPARRARHVAWCSTKSTRVSAARSPKSWAASCTRSPPTPRCSA